MTAPAEAAPTRDEIDRANRALWDEMAELHVGGKGYRLAEFRAGQAILDPLVMEEIGDLRGLSILHLQCHFGLDTLSLARLGARVTGVDFSGRAIAAARDLSAETGVAGRFVECKVEEAVDHIEGRFDRVFVSWGALIWLPELAPWARCIAHFLKPGGKLHLIEGHPLLYGLALEESGAGPTLAIGLPCLGPGRAQRFDTDNDYADESARLKNSRSWEFNHGLGEIFGQLLAAGLKIESYREHTLIPWRALPKMVARDGYFFALPDGAPSIPLSYSLTALKP